MSAAGANLNTCGWTDLPCLAIPFVIQSLYSKTECIRMNHGTYDVQTESATIRSTLDITGITSENELPTVPLQAESEDLFTIGDGACVTFTDITFSVISYTTTASDIHSFAYSAFYVTYQSTLTLTRVTLNRFPVAEETQFSPIEADLIRTAGRGSIILHSVTVTQLSFDIEVSLISSAGSLSIDGGTFSSISLTDTPLFSLTNVPTFNETSNSSFFNITREDEGGAVLEFTSSTSTRLSLIGAQFTDCGTRKEGGVGCAVKVTITNSASSLDVNDALFISSTDIWENTQLCGLWIIASLEELSSFKFLCTSPKASIYQTKGLKYFASLTEDGAPLTSFPLFHLFFGPASTSFTDTFYISTIGIEINTCGWSDLPCTTITEALNYAGTSIANFYLLSGLHTAEQNKMLLTLSRNIVGESNTNKTVSEISSSDYSASLSCSSSESLEGTEDGMFIIDDNAEISFISLHFTLDTQSPISSSLIAAHTGSLTLSDIIITPNYPNTQETFTISHSLISLSPTISSASFSITAQLISLSEGNGSVISADLTEDIQSFSVIECSFTNCSAEYGGCIYLSIHSIPTTLSIHSISSTLCTSNDDQGTAIYFSLSDPLLLYTLHTQLFTSTSPSLFTHYSISIYSLYWVHVSKPTQLFSFSLSHIHFSPGKNIGGTSSLIVGKDDGNGIEGVDVPGCGWSELPCLSIATAVSHLSGLSEIRLIEGRHGADRRGLCRLR